MAYTLKMVKERNLEQEFEARTCGNYFDHVWGVHPIADIPENRLLKFTGFKPSIFEFSANQTIIEGDSAYFSFLKNTYSINFIFSQVRMIYFLVKLIRKEKIQLLLSTDPYFGGLLAIILKFFTKARVIIWVVANYDEIYQASGALAFPRIFKKNWVEKCVERLVFRHADLIAGGNENNYENAIKNGASRNKATIFPVSKLIYPAHLSEPSKRNKDIFLNSLSTTNKYFIYVGRLISLKHPDDAIKAFALIAEKFNNCGLIMAGDGIMLDELKALTLNLEINEKVFFLGNVSQQRLAEILPGCFAALSPLTGRALIEVALSGLPIVTYDRDWQKDFIEKSDSGVVVEYRNWIEMGREGVKLLSDLESARRYGLKARQYALNFCDYERIFEHEKNEFDKLIK